MDTFFRRHFKRKETALQGNSDANASRQRRPSVAVPTSKARRRSSVGLPSSALTQRRRSSLQLQPGEPCAGGGRLAKTPRKARWAGHARRRSSTTTLSLNPRFTVCRRKVGKLRTIDSHLLGPSMLLASLIQMAEEEEEGGGVGLPAGEQQVEMRGGADSGITYSRSSSLHSDGDDSSGYTSSNQSEGSQLSEAEQLPEEKEEEEEEDEEEDEASCSSAPHFSPASTPPSASKLEILRKPPEVLSTSRSLIRAPRCLRRNSSQVFVADSTPFRCNRASSQKRRRRISTISKAGSPWPGRGHPLPNRKSSVYYLNHPALYRGPGALSPLGVDSYDSRLESLSAFLLYVV